MRAFKNFIYFILSLQEKILTSRLKKTIGVKSSNRKEYFSSGCFLTLDTIAESEKNKMEEELSLILKAANYEPKEILKYIEKHGTEVFCIDNLKLLNSIGIAEGFIYPLKGFKAMYLASIVKKKLCFKTNEMFVLGIGDINKYYFIYHFYNWYAFTHGIVGIDTESFELLNKYLYNANEEELNSLQLADIYKLKEVIKQDKSAIEFVIKLCKQQETSKKTLDKIKDSGANI